MSIKDRRSWGVGGVGLVIAVVILTWWSAAPADAAQPFAVTFFPRGGWTLVWPEAGTLQDCGLTAAIGATLLAVAASVRRVC